MTKIGSTILLRQAGKLIKCVVIDVDATFITLRMEYKKDKGFDFKVKANSKNILKYDGIDVEAFTSNNFFQA